MGWETVLLTHCNQVEKKTKNNYKFINMTSETYREGQAIGIYSSLLLE